ncbi:membrane integrity-associated transporter subunit PqiC [Marinobacter salinisoli]|uniref:Membrane integrity-associated transporter subunit PqiC n=1 Tax=Marinobacter salinisoli TaxID=2769486 RepID=A0ABX7MRG9_9GAMM|nr:ABC-type transport auxiliary lipoprotein family protein [Marinobacter salinisoli]QSP93989.1 membrane integrity-associated transporter subunit PqiC [Marinobacter salinisoli]
MIRKLTLCASILVLLHGCSVFPNPEARRVMDFSAATVDYQANERRPFSLRVDTPYASDPFNGSRILAKPTPWEFRIYEEVRWRDTIPVIVRDLLVQTLRKAKGFESVVSETNPVDTDWTLISELSAFHTENGRPTPAILIELHSQIVANRSREKLCTRTFSVMEISPTGDIEAIVQTFNRTGAAMARDVAAWASQCGASGDSAAGKRSGQAALR